MDEADLPIDIHSQKLLEWLISRQHCPRNWQTLLPDISKCDQNNYFDMKSAWTEQGFEEQGFFSSGKDTGKKLLAASIKLYSNQNMYLAETASGLSRLLHYEVPALKKQIANMEQEEIDMGKREVSLKKTSENAKESWREVCREYNVDLSDSTNIEKDAKKQLLRSAYKLQDYSHKITSIITSNSDHLVEMVESYRKISGFINGDKNCEFLKNLYALAKNTVDTEWDANVKAAILGEQLESPDSGMEIGIEEENIDWSQYMDNGGDEEEAAVPNGGSGSSWDMTPDAIQYNEIENGDFVEIQTGTGDNAQTSKNSPLLNSKFRQSLTTEIGEIKSFLKAKSQSAGENELLSVAQALNLSSEEQHTLSCEKCNEWIDVIEQIEQELSNEGFTRLLRIVDSDVYVGKLCADLKRKSLLSSKYKAQIDECLKTKKFAIDSRNSLQPKLKEIQVACKKRKVFLEGEISKKYNNRPVNIMGQFNFV